MQKQIINELYIDALRKSKDIASKVGISVQYISNFMKYLKVNNKIRFSIVENVEVEDSRYFFIEIKSNPEEPEILDHMLNRLPGLVSLDGIIGQNSLIARFKVYNNTEFSEILERLDRIVATTRFRHYKVIECIKTFKDGGKMLLHGGPGDSGGPVSLSAQDKMMLNILRDSPSKFSFEFLIHKLKSRGVRLSYPTCRRRINKMIDSGIIHSFTIKVCLNFINETDFPLKFYLQIIPKNLSEYNLIATNVLIYHREIVELYRTGQEYGLLAVVRTRSIRDYRRLLKDLYETGKIQDTFTTLVIEEHLPAIFRPFA
ncbi:MAG: Lrp/AsnC family transcriptional regulator [Promethearchaeota archaeon]